MTWLLDTNVISELRKGDRANPGLRRWISERSDDAWLSVLTLGELRRGIELKRRKDPSAANRLEIWMVGLTTHFGSKILPVSAAVVDVWGRLGVPNPVPVIDGLLAATAIVHELTLVTRKTRDVEGTGAVVFNPFD